jgi:hypothetical protein
MICWVYFDRHAVAVPLRLLKEASLGAHAMSPAATITGSPAGGAVVVVVVLVGVSVVVVVLVGVPVVVVVLVGVPVVVVVVLVGVPVVVVVVLVGVPVVVVDEVVVGGGVAPATMSCGGVAVSRLVMFRAAVAAVDRT